MAIARRPALLAIAGLLALPAPARPQVDRSDLEAFLAQIQHVIAVGSPYAYRALLSPPQGRAAAQAMAEEMVPSGVTRVTLRERSRVPLQGTLPGEGFRVFAEVFSERGRQGDLGRWRLDVKLARGGSRSTWWVVDQERLSPINPVYHLELDASTEYAVSDLVVNSTDFRLLMPSGHAFLAETPQGGVTAMVLVGSGQMQFTPRPAAERTQLRLFAGSDTLLAGFDVAFVRLNPVSFDARVSGTFAPREVDVRDLRRAQDVFAEMVDKSYALNLGELSSDLWSVLPSGDDMLAEVETRRFDTLTYTRSMNQAEDVSLFHRQKQRNICTYASEDKLLSRGRFYNQDNLINYDVLRYDLDATFEPEREWIEGLATVTLRVTGRETQSLTLRLDEDLVVRSVSSPSYGPLMHVRVIDRNDLIVNLPRALSRGTELELTVVYDGRLSPQPIDHEAVVIPQEPDSAMRFRRSLEPLYLYSSQTHWYPRSPVNDYATATIQVTVPEEYDCIATGLETAVPPSRLKEITDREEAKVYLFVAAQPVKYLSCVISRFALIDSSSDDVGGGPVALVVQANPRQRSRARALQETARAILDFYAGLMEAAPYPRFTLAVTEGALPGGHSPAYFAVLSEPAGNTPFRWFDDPMKFDNFPSFFVAHEIAHQWWGQGVGWANYHEQWLSEGLSQYFATLYAAHENGAEVFGDLMRQMRRWSLRYSDQGPIHLGYRLGHIQGDSRIFRALVYGKASVVLHMLRRFVGDEAFFGGLRAFYGWYLFRKANSDDLRRVMEAASGVPLGRFFEQWIYGSEIPRLRFSFRTRADGTDGGLVTVRFEQAGQPFDLPVTVTLVLDSGARKDVTVKVTGPVTETDIPFAGRLANVLVNDDELALAEIDR